jgi:hypothetical protein
MEHSGWLKILKLIASLTRRACKLPCDIRDQGFILFYAQLHMIVYRRFERGEAGWPKYRQEYLYEHRHKHRWN